MSAEPVRVLFIGGMGRSGSTLLDRLVGSLPGAVSIGEFRKFWRRGALDRNLCGCGVPVRDCPFWGEVVAQAFGGWEQLDGAALQAAEARAFGSLRHLLQLRVPLARSAAWKRDFATFADTRTRLFRAVARVSGARVVVDSSKGPWYGLALTRLPDLDVRTVHLVRDARAVAYSWSRIKEAPQEGDTVSYMPRLSAATVGAQWMAKALQMELGWPGAGRSLRLFYEDFVADPEAGLRRVARFTGLPAPLPGEGAGGFALDVQHTVLGNPMRFERGPLRIRLDDEWRTAMAPAAKRAVVARSWPLLLAYGYAGPRTRRGRPPR